MILKGLPVEQMTQIFLEGKIVKIWPKNFFFVSFCKFFPVCPLTPHELQPKILPNERPY